MKKTLFLLMIIQINLNAGDFKLQITLDGKPDTSILISNESNDFEIWVAGELQKYVEEISGAKLPITQDAEILKKDSAIIVGRPETNNLLRSMKNRGIIDYSSLKNEGMLLKTVDYNGQNVLIVSGYDDRGIMYAAYELLERLGVVFQITNDVIPEHNPNLSVSFMDVCISPAFENRGMHVCHGMGTWNMGLSDYRHHLDQMAKLKLNRLFFIFGMKENVWNEFSYKGKKTNLTDPDAKVTNFVSWPSTSVSYDDIKVGKDCFPDKYLGPAEFSGVKDVEQAYEIARGFLNAIIEHAHARKIEVWLSIGAIPDVPIDLVPSEFKDKLSNHWSGVRMPAGHPDTLGIYVAAIEKAINDYPEADGIGFFGAESSYDTSDNDTQKLMAEYDYAKELMPTFEDLEGSGLGHVFARNKWNQDYNEKHGTETTSLDADFAEACLAAKIFSSVRSRHKDIKLVMCTLFRPYMARVMDKMMPEGVVLMSLETLANDRPIMHFFEGVKDHEFVIMPRIGHDGGQMHLQLNLFQYEYDQILKGLQEYGCQGFIGQLIKERGLEINVSYFAEGGWNPDIKLLEFYPDYTERLFGSKSFPLISKALIHLDYNLGALSTNPQRLFSTSFCHTDFYPLHYVNKSYSGYSAEYIRKLKEPGVNALSLLERSKKTVPSGSLGELDYIIYKVRSYNDYLEVIALRREAFALFAAAKNAKEKGNIEIYRQGLIDTDSYLLNAEQLVVKVGQQMIPYCSNPTEKHLLMDLNKNAVAYIAFSREYVRNLLEKQNETERPGIEDKNKDFIEAESLLD